MAGHLQRLDAFKRQDWTSYAMSDRFWTWCGCPVAEDVDKWNGHETLCSRRTFKRPGRQKAMH